MALATVRSCALSGVTALPVVVEVHLGGGLPGTAIVGLPQSAVKESKDRVKAAIRHAGFVFPQVKIIVNLAPADLPKRGGRFDLPIALGILIASHQLPEGVTDGLVVVGELGLGGDLRGVEGVLSTSQSCVVNDEGLLLPKANLAEAARCKRVQVCAVSTLVGACDALLVAKGQRLVNASKAHRTVNQQANGFSNAAASAPDEASFPGGTIPELADVVGQSLARRALEVAAAGGHNVLFCGPPGTGKSMLASRLPGILPPMTEQEATETAAIRSVSRAGFDPASWGVRPFRTPHHTASGVALVGGGLPPLPGEISLSHNGVLFLDELTEYRRSVLEVLREPMESGHINLVRGAHQVDFPARFQLVAAMNPCPCGHHGDADGACRCSPDAVLNYRARISAPFLDRIDLHVGVQREPIDATALAFLSSPQEGRSGWRGALEKGNSREVPAGVESSAVVRARVVSARQRQTLRQGRPNSQLSPDALARHCRIDSAGKQLIEDAATRFKLSLRTVHRSLAVARTVADLTGADTVESEHLLEALGYRERVAVSVEAPVLRRQEGF